MDFSIKAFQDLQLEELYALLALRQKVFVLEQECPYVDADGVDLKSHHVLLTDEGELVGCARIIPPNVQYQGYSSIGRVIVDKNARRNRTGTKLMDYCIRHCLELYPDHPIKISAQSYLIGFYENLGFRRTREAYLEDDIPHVAMIYSEV